MTIATIGSQGEIERVVAHVGARVELEVAEVGAGGHVGGAGGAAEVVGAVVDLDVLVGVAAFPDVAV